MSINEVGTRNEAARHDMRTRNATQSYRAFQTETPWTRARSVVPRIKRWFNDSWRSR